MYRAKNHAGVYKRMNHRLGIMGIALVASFLFSTVATASVFVSPAEMWVSMENGFIDGTTGKIITVKNTYDYNVSVKAWMLHPDIIEWMRPNKTLIDNISWISIEPSRVIIPPGGQAQFSIAVYIPNETKNQTYDCHWETRAALQIDAVSANYSTTVKEGYLVRVYIDTPSTPVPPSDGGFFLSPFVLINLFIVIVAITIVVLVYSFHRKRRY